MMRGPQSLEIGCYDEGALRAHLDGELPQPEASAVAAHLAGCARCRAEREALERRAALAAQLLQPPAAPSAQAALERFYRHRGTAGRAEGAHQTHRHKTRRTGMSSLSFMGRRRWAALAATLVAALALLALPPVRAAADQLLQVFRVRTVVFIPVSEDRIRQLESLDFDENTLFIAEPEVVNTPAEPRTFATAEEAAAAAGLAALEQPTDLPAPPTSVEFTVTDRTVSQFQVNVEAARQLLALVGVSDVTLPDALGTQPITIDLAPVVMARYEGPGYSIELVQGHSPDVTLPDGVDLAQLGRAALRLLGMAPDQADALSQQIDWNSTLVFPFPANLDTIRQVSINGAPGLLVSGEAGRDDASQLYWQRGDRFFVLMAEGSGRDERALGDLLRAAESVR